MTGGRVAYRDSPRVAPSLGKRLYRMRYFYLFFVPVFVYFFLFHYKPMYGILIAFQDYRILKGVAGSPWVGLENFRVIVDSQMFSRVLGNTVVISLLRIVFGFPAPIVLALLLNEISHGSYKRAVQAVSYLPHFISWVVLGGIIRRMLSPTGGAVNDVLGRLFGMPAIYWLTTSWAFRPILVITGIWKEVGWASIIYLAAMANLDVELYESAYVDGANRLHCALHITIPSIAYVIAITFILGLGGFLDAGFDQILNLYNPMVYDVADIIDTYVYRKGILELSYGVAEAVALLKNAVGFALVLLANLAVRRFSEYALW